MTAGDPGITDTDTATLPDPTDAQRAAAAKLAFAAEQTGSVAVLCGPGGVGKTTVLRLFARSPGRPGRVARLVSVEAFLHGERHPAAVPEGAEPDVLLVDDADHAEAGALAAAVAAVRRRWARGAIVLAGTGRLFTLVSADPRLERAVRLRIALPVFTAEESSRLIRERLVLKSPTADTRDISRTFHEIAAGVPASLIRLAEMAAMLAAAYPERDLSPDDIEAIHRRLSPHAA